MSERFISDEEIANLSGARPRMPAGIPHAVCLHCGEEYPSFYAYMAHDCLVDLKAKKSYGEWLLLFQAFGMGILRTPEDRKFPLFSKVITGKTMLTFHLQSDLYLPSSHPPYKHELWYFGSEWEALELHASSLVPVQI
jgi:hypothetical protein